MAKKIQAMNVMTVIAAARELGIDPGYLYLQLRAGRIAGQKVGRRWEVSSEAIENRKRARQSDTSRAAAAGGM